MTSQRDEQISEEDTRDPSDPIASYSEDIQRAIEAGRAQHARLRELGYQDFWHFSKEMRRRAIRHQFSPEYASRLIEHLSL